MRHVLAAAAVALAATVAVVSGLIRGGGAAAAAHPTVTVRMGEFFYRPKELTVHIGQRVRFLNVGKIQHTVADSDRAGTVRSKLIKPRPLAHGQAQTVSFAHAGTLYYLCTFHPTLMRGRIVVVR